MAAMKLGKKPARPEAMKFKLAKYIEPRALPKPPKSFGHEKLWEDPGHDWGMFGNNDYGDCVLAGAAHETMIWAAMGGNPATFNDRAVLQAYSEITGFNPNDSSSDQGTDMTEAASYRRKTGIPDLYGTRHKVAAYLAIEPGNILEHYQALYLFGAVGVGVEFPSSAMDQFDAGKTWSLRGKGTIEGGHYVPLVAKRSHVECVTWGRVQPMTLAWFVKYNDESVAYVSEEALLNGKSPEGFDAASLLADLNALTAA